MNKCLPLEQTRPYCWQETGSVLQSISAVGRGGVFEPNLAESSITCESKEVISSVNVLEAIVWITKMSVETAPTITM